VKHKLPWPPPYVVRRSHRAKHIRLIIDPLKGLVIVLPKAAKLKEALDFLESKRKWVEKHGETLMHERFALSDTRFDLPYEISLQGLDRTWQICYHHLPKRKRITLRAGTKKLVFSGRIKDFRVCVPFMKRWLKQRAENHLTKLLSHVAKECGFKYIRVSFRAQKTMWGSCSRKGDISLNYKLLFLPPYLVHYVLVHELCHTVYFDHSKDFWNLVGQYVDDHRLLEKKLHRADQYVPDWFH